MKSFLISQRHEVIPMHEYSGTVRVAESRTIGAPPHELVVDEKLRVVSLPNSRCVLRTIHQLFQHQATRCRSSAWASHTSELWKCPRFQSSEVSLSGDFLRCPQAAQQSHRLQRRRQAEQRFCGSLSSAFLAALISRTTNLDLKFGCAGSPLLVSSHRTPIGLRPPVSWRHCSTGTFSCTTCLWRYSVLNCLAFFTSPAGKMPLKSSQYSSMSSSLTFLGSIDAADQVNVCVCHGLAPVLFVVIHPVSFLTYPVPWSPRLSVSIDHRHMGPLTRCSVFETK